MWVNLLAILALAFAATAHAQSQAQPPAPSAAAPRSTCLVCHSNLGGRLSAPAVPFPTDVHAERGLTCASCHGGDPTSMDRNVAMGAASGFRGKPSRQQVPEFCGRCHSDPTFMHRYKPDVATDQVAQYYTSRHGQRLRQGDTRVATCINCHSVHNIKRVSDPSAPVYPTNIPATCGTCHSSAEYMAGSALKNTSQVEDYRRSMHYQAVAVAGDLSAPTCATCHGSHGATPPGVPSVVDVCGTCHAHNRRLFDESPHRAAFAAIGAPGCVQCHSNHAILRSSEAMLAPGPTSVCLGCHSPEDAGAQRAQAMTATLRELDQRIQSARDALARADHAGMDVTTATADLTAAHNHLVMARTTVHSLDLDKVSAETTQGIAVAERVLQEGNDKLEEVEQRRRGVALFSVLVLAVVLTIYLYIKTSEKEGKESTQ
jgi:predicted CXXCH cytochrome family protein